MIQWLIHFAQTAPDIPISPNVGTGIAGLAGVGLATWYVYYKEVVAIPRERAEFRQQMKDLQEAHLRQIDEVTKRFDQTLREHKQECTAEKVQLLEELKEARDGRHADSQALTTCINNLSEKLNSMITEIRSIIPGNARSKRAGEG